MFEAKQYDGLYKVPYQITFTNSTSRMAHGENTRPTAADWRTPLPSGTIPLSPLEPPVNSLELELFFNGSRGEARDFGLPQVKNYLEIFVFTLNQ